MVDRHFNPGSPPQQPDEAAAKEQFAKMVEVAAQTHHEAFREIAKAEGVETPPPTWDELSDGMRGIARRCIARALRKAMVAAGPPAGANAGEPELPAELPELAKLSAEANQGRWTTAHKYRSAEDRAFYVAAVNFVRLMLPPDPSLLAGGHPGRPDGRNIPSGMPPGGPPPGGKPGFERPGGYPMRPVGRKDALRMGLPVALALEHTALTDEALLECAAELFTVDEARKGMQ